MESPQDSVQARENEMRMKGGCCGRILHRVSHVALHRANMDGRTCSILPGEQA